MGVDKSQDQVKKCLNCDAKLTGKYCSVCGQKADTQRFTINYVVNNLLTGFLYFEKGLPYTIKQLTLNPSKTVVGFLEGKRANLVVPIQYLIFGVTLLMLSDYLFPHSGNYSGDTGGDVQYEFGYRFGQFYGRTIKENLKYFWISTPLFHGLISNLFYSRKNFSEHLIINSYIVGHSSLYTAFIQPFVDAPLVFSPLPYLCVFVMHIFTFKKLIKPKLLWIIPLLSVLLSSVLFIILPMIVSLVYYVLIVK